MWQDKYFDEHEQIIIDRSFELVFSERWLSRSAVRTVTGEDMDFLMAAKTSLKLQDPSFSEERLFYAIRSVLHLVWGGLKISDDDWSKLMSYSHEDIELTFRKADKLHDDRMTK